MLIRGQKELFKAGHLEFAMDGGKFHTKSSQMVQCEAPKIAKLVYNSNNYGLWYL